MPDDGLKFEISPHELADWIRSKADAAGFTDREIAVVESSVDADSPVFCYGAPTLSVTISPLANSRYRR